MASQLLVRVLVAASLSCWLAAAEGQTLAQKLGRSPAAQQSAPPQARLPSKIKPIIPKVEPGTWGFAFTTINGLRDGGDSANHETLPQVVALRGFIFGFNNGDHKLRRLAVVPDGQFTHFSFADQNGDDPFRANATYTTFTSGVAGEASATGGGKFDVPLGPKPFPASAYTLVLRGFGFRRADGTDANLRNIGIKLDGTRNIAQVSLIDDQGTDFTALANTLGAIALAGAAGLPGLIETTTVQQGMNDRSFGIDALQGRVPGMVGQYRGYKVLVQYAWIPTALVKKASALSGAGHHKPIVTAPIDALTGFEFTFTNSDHYLLGIGVNGEGGNDDVFFQDANTDDPMQWTATYLTLDRSVLSKDQAAQMLRLYRMAKEAR